MGQWIAYLLVGFLTAWAAHSAAMHFAKRTSPMIVGAAFWFWPLYWGAFIMFLTGTIIIKTVDRRRR